MALDTIQASASDDILASMSTEDIERELQMLEEIEAKASRAREEVAMKIANEQEQEWSRRKSLRTVKEDEWLHAQALYLGPLAYNDQRYKDTPFVKGGKNRRPDVNIVGNKCDIAISALETTQFGAGDKNWSIRQSPAPEGQGDVVTAAMLMDREIADQLERCRYGVECRQAMTDFVILGTGIMKSPLNVGKPKKGWEDLGGGVFKPIYSSDFTPGVRRVDPWLFFPNPSATSWEDLDDTQEVHPWSQRKMKELLYNPGFDGEAVKRILKEAPKRSNHTALPDSKTLTNNNEAWTDRYIVIEGYRKLPISDLEAYYKGDSSLIPTTVDESGDFVFCEIWTCQNEILRIAEPMLESCVKPPYEGVVWKADPSSVFGFGVALIMADQQRVVTKAWHDVLDNSQVSAGPQVVVNKALLEAADGDTATITPWKVWNVSDFDVKVTDAISFFSPPNNQEALMSTLNAARSFADEESGIPMLQGGFESPQGEQSATGTAIQAQRGTAALFSKSTRWDDYMTTPIIHKMYEWNMLFNPKPEIKGDFEIDVDSTTSALKQQIELSNLEKLSVEASQNPMTAEWIKMDELLRTRLQMMRISNTDIVKTPEVVEQERAQKQEEPNPDMIKLQIEQQRVQIEQEELALKREQLQYELSQGQQRELWEHEERMATAEARNFENQADMYGKAADRDIAMMQLASTEGIKLADIEARLQANVMKSEFEKFKAGAQLELEAAKVSNVQQEINLKRAGKSGI